MEFEGTSLVKKVGKEIVMEMNENFVEQTENVEQTTEQTPVEKTYTQSEVDAMMGKRVARTEAKIRKEYDRKYGQLEEVLKAGTGKQNIEELTNTFTQFYENKGIQIRKKPEYTDEDIRVLAQADAAEFINSGYEDVVEEVDRLAQLGAENMTAREKAVFKTLAEHRQNAERGRELGKIGVTEDVYNSAEFKDFAKMFNPNVPITKVYDQYRKNQPKQETRTMGSMKQVQAKGTKDFYSPEEIDSLTEEQLLDPKVWEIVRQCMTSR